MAAHLWFLPPSTWCWMFLGVFFQHYKILLNYYLVLCDISSLLVVLQEQVSFWCEVSIGKWLDFSVSCKCCSIVVNVDRGTSPTAATWRSKGSTGDLVLKDRTCISNIYYKMPRAPIEQECWDAVVPRTWISILHIVSQFEPSGYCDNLGWNGLNI